MMSAAKVKTPTGWEYIATGPQGPAGPPGPQGMAGVQGAQGVKGDATSTIYDPFTTVGISPLPTIWLLNTAIASPSGQMAGLFFIANTNRPCNRLAVLPTTLAGATPTLIRMGVYKVDPTTFALTGLAASTTSDIALLGTNGWRASPITGGSEVVGGVWTPVIGARYCSVLIVVTAAAAPSVAGNASHLAFAYSLPSSAILPMIYVLTAQTDLPAAPGVPTGTNLNASIRAPGVVGLFS